MIFGIGTDIVNVSRVQTLIDKHGDQFASRILSSDEYEEYQQATQKAHFLAKRFAAKEATVKAFGTGMRLGMSHHDISVDHDHNGRPILKLTDKVKSLFSKHNITQSHISISDEKEYAVAFVVLE